MPAFQYLLCLLFLLNWNLLTTNSFMKFSSPVFCIPPFLVCLEFFWLFLSLLKCLISYGFPLSTGPCYQLFSYSVIWLYHLHPWTHLSLSHQRFCIIHLHPSSLSTNPDSYALRLNVPQVPQTWPCTHRAVSQQLKLKELNRNFGCYLLQGKLSIESEFCQVNYLLRQKNQYSSEGHNGIQILYMSSKKFKWLSILETDKCDPYWRKKGNQWKPAARDLDVRIKTEEVLSRYYTYVQGQTDSRN